MKTAIAAIALAIGMGVSQAQSSQGLEQTLVVVVGVPFSADRTTQTSWLQLDGTPGSQIEKGRYYRDSQGRLRAEGRIDGAGVWHTLAIKDPVAGFTYMIPGTERGRVAYRTPLPPTLKPRTVSQLAAGEAIRPSIGSQTIAGFLANGHRDVLESLTLETWISPQLMTTMVSKTMMVSKTIRSKQATTTTLSNVVLAEPDSQLFQPPQGYTFLSSGN